MSGIFGYPSHEDFLKAVDAEISSRELHSHRDGLRPGQSKPKQQARARRQPDTKTPDIADRHAQAMLKARPGSPEREAAVRAINPELFDQAKAEQSAQQIAMLLDRWEQSPVGDAYATQVQQELARLTWDTQSADVFYAVRERIADVTGDSDYFDRMFEHRLGVEAQREQAQYEQAETERTAEVHAALQRTYQAVERDLGPAGLLAADEVAQTWGSEIYDPEVDADAVQVGLRAAAELGRGQERVGNTFRTHQALSEEMRRVGAPGSTWNDEDRAQWEAQMREADLETAVRLDERLNDPDAAAARALQAHAIERSGSTPFEAALSEELDALSAEPAHRQALRDANVEAWEARHTDDGRETVNLSEEQRR